MGRVNEIVRCTEKIDAQAATRFTIPFDGGDKVLDAQTLEIISRKFDDIFNPPAGAGTLLAYHDATQAPRDARSVANLSIPR